MVYFKEILKFKLFSILGDLERLSRFWMIGTCKPNIQEKRASEPLSIAQFTSAFLLLLIGLGFSMFLLILEHLYMKYVQTCRLLQVGSWSRMTGYALAFPRNSKFKNMFDAKILELRENGKIGVYIHNEEIQMSLGIFESIGRISFSKIA